MHNPAVADPIITAYTVWLTTPEGQAVVADGRRDPVAAFTTLCEAVVYEHRRDQ